ncbi:MAG: TVP38/TMEM64 family protein [Firmicutes bacterium]|nr:TVP38/TMEM64 family protein [Bacillota bacterium]
MKKYLLPSLILLVTITLATTLWRDELIGIIKAASSGDMQIAAQVIQKYSNIAILVSILINVVISLLGVIPSVFLTGANILVFGLYGGFLVSWAGEVIGAAISFLLYRWGVKNVAKLSTDQWKLSKTVSSLPGTKQIYFLTILRMAPFIPSGLINLFGAITTISFTNFIIATGVGKVPSLLLESAFSYNLLTLGKNYIYLGISILVAIILYLGVKKELNRLRKQPQ